MPRSRRSGGTLIRWLEEKTVRSWMRMSPPLGSSRPAMQRRIVVLPHPLEPSSTEIAPARNETVKSEITSTLPNDLTRRSIATLAADPSEPCVDKGLRAWHGNVLHAGWVERESEGCTTSRRTLEKASGSLQRPNLGLTHGAAERLAGARSPELDKLHPKDVEPTLPLA